MTPMIQTGLGNLEVGIPGVVGCSHIATNPGSTEHTRHGLCGTPLFYYIFISVSMIALYSGSIIHT